MWRNMLSFCLFIKDSPVPILTCTQPCSVVWPLGQELQRCFPVLAGILDSFRLNGGLNRSLFLNTLGQRAAW